MNSIRSILSTLKKADLDFSLIKNGDRILVHIDSNVSSFILFKALEVYKYYSKKKYRIIPVYLDYGYDLENKEILKANIKDLEIVDSTEIRDNILARGSDATKSAWNKLERKKLIELAKEYHCNLIALGSIHEDSINHLYRGTVFEGKISVLRPKAKVSGTAISFIRPLIYCYQSEISRFANESNFSLKETENPFAYRSDEKLLGFLDSLYEDNSFAKDNIRKALSHEYPDLYKDYKEITLGDIKLVKVLDNKEKVTYNIIKNNDIIGNICYLFIDHHLVKFSYTKLEDKHLISSIRYLIDELLDDTPRLTVYFSRAKRILKEEFGLKETLIRGHKAFAVKLKK